MLLDPKVETAGLALIGEHELAGERLGEGGAVDKLAVLCGFEVRVSEYSQHIFQAGGVLDINGVIAAYYNLYPQPSSST